MQQQPRSNPPPVPVYEYGGDGRWRSGGGEGDGSTQAFGKREQTAAHPSLSRTQICWLSLVCLQSAPSAAGLESVCCHKVLRTS